MCVAVGQVPPPVVYGVGRGFGLPPQPPPAGMRAPQFAYSGRPPMSVPVSRPMPPVTAAASPRPTADTAAVQHLPITQQSTPSVQSGMQFVPTQVRS